MYKRFGWVFIAMSTTRNPSLLTLFDDRHCFRRIIHRGRALPDSHCSTGFVAANDAVTIAPFRNEMGLCN